MKQDSRKPADWNDEFPELPGHPPSDSSGEKPMENGPDRARYPFDVWLLQLLREGRVPGRDADGSLADETRREEVSLTPDLVERLKKAARWGLEEREFAAYEARLGRRVPFGQFLRWARGRTGETWETLSQRIGVQLATTGAMLESGKVSPFDVPPEELAKLVHALDLSIWTVLERLPLPSDYAGLPEEVPEWRQQEFRLEAAAQHVAYSLEFAQEMASLARSIADSIDPRFRTTHPRAAGYRRALLKAWREQRSR